MTPMYGTGIRWRTILPIRLSDASHRLPTPTALVSTISSLTLRAAAAVGCLLTAVAAHAQQQPVDTAAQRSTAHAVPVPSATAARKDGPIRIDGHIDEAAWAKATPISEMTQIDPDEGKPATRRSDIRFLYDDEALYVSARL